MQLAGNVSFPQITAMSTSPSLEDQRISNLSWATVKGIQSNGLVCLWLGSDYIMVAS